MPRTRQRYFSFEYILKLETARTLTEFEPATRDISEIGSSFNRHGSIQRMQGTKPQLRADVEENTMLTRIAAHAISTAINSFA